MYITKEDYRLLADCVDILYYKRGISIKLTREQEETVAKALATVIKLKRKRDKDMTRATSYMDKKRLIDPRYYRSKPKMAKVLAESAEYPTNDAEEIMQAYNLAELTKIYRLFWKAKGGR